MARRFLLMAEFSSRGDANGSAEIFDRSTGAFCAAGATMSSARSMHSAALLPDGRVLIVGGSDTTGNDLSSGEIFDPAGPELYGRGRLGDLAPTRKLLRTAITRI